MLDFIGTYVKYILLHRYNKVSKESIELLDQHWKNKPTKGVKLWVYNKVRTINGHNI